MAKRSSERRAEGYPSSRPRYLFETDSWVWLEVATTLQKDSAVAVQQMVVEN